MFQFNFNKTEDKLEVEEENNEKDLIPTIKSKELEIEKIIPDIKELINKYNKEINSNEKLKENKEIELVERINNISTIFNIKYFNQPIINNTETLFYKSPTDLKPNVYEGGYKIWECTFDLLNYIKNNNINFNNLNILDLGCGSGLLGLYSLQNNLTSNVYFQDFNKEVLESWTLPNIILNNKNNNFKLFYGDWNSFNDVLLNIKFDIIVTSETIYNVNNYMKLINLFKKILKQNGVIYLAAKVYYFGVGGCIYDFEKLLKENQFEVETCWEYNDNVKRKIIKIIQKL